MSNAMCKRISNVQNLIHLIPLEVAMKLFFAGNYGSSEFLHLGVNYVSDPLIIIKGLLQTPRSTVSITGTP